MSGGQLDNISNIVSACLETNKQQTKTPRLSEQKSSGRGIFERCIIDHWSAVSKQCLYSDLRDWGNFRSLCTKK
jgi:hypothetical protein